MMAVNNYHLNHFQSHTSAGEDDVECCDTLSEVFSFSNEAMCDDAICGNGKNTVILCYQEYIAVTQAEKTHYSVSQWNFFNLTVLYYIIPL